MLFVLATDEEWGRRALDLEDTPHGVLSYSSCKWFWPVGDRFDLTKIL